MKTVLYNEAKYPGGALKDRCEDFVNCLDGSGKGFYSRDNEASTGILSLDYDNTSSVINYVEDIVDNLISKKRKALNNLESTIHGGWFASGLIYCSFSLDNELAESSNQLKNEEKGLNDFLQSFVEYTNGMKDLESRISIGLGKVKDLDTTVEKNLQKMDDAANMTNMQKVRSIAKTFAIDIVGGGIIMVSGCGRVVAGTATLEKIGWLSSIKILEGGTMTVSGANCAANGL